MESFKSADLKDTRTFSHDTDASEIANHVESSSTKSSHGERSSLENDQSMAAQQQLGNVDEQQPQSDGVNEQQPGSDAAMNPCSSRQALPNQIENVPDLIEPLELQQWWDGYNQQLLEQQQNGLHDQPPQVRPRRPPLNPRRNRLYQFKVPHYHVPIGNRYWKFVDFNQRVTVRVQPLLRERQQQRQRRLAYECYRLPMFKPPLITTSVDQPNDQPDQSLQIRPQHLPLASRLEIEPGIFEEIYSHTLVNMCKPKMFGVKRCLCRNHLNPINWENYNVITVIISTPNLTVRYRMNLNYEGPFLELFRAYFGLTRETSPTVFVAKGRRLYEEDSPKDIGMMDYDEIYTFVDAVDYNAPKKKKRSQNNLNMS